MNRIQPRFWTYSYIELLMHYMYYNISESIARINSYTNRISLVKYWLEVVALLGCDKVNFDVNSVFTKLLGMSHKSDIKKSELAFGQPFNRHRINF